MLPLSSFWKRERQSSFDLLIRGNLSVLWVRANHYDIIRLPSCSLQSLVRIRRFSKTCGYTSTSQQVKQCPLCHNLHNACSCKTKILTKHRLTMSYQDAQFPLNRDELTSQIRRVILIEILNARMPLCRSLSAPWYIVTNKSQWQQFCNILGLV